MATFKKGDFVTVYNQTFSGKPIIEGRATIVRPTGVEFQYRVKFVGAKLGDPGRTGVDRFVFDGECQAGGQVVGAEACEPGVILHLSPAGRAVVEQIRAHKAAGGTFGNFHETLKLETAGV